MAASHRLTSSSRAKATASKVLRKLASTGRHNIRRCMHVRPLTAISRVEIVKPPPLPRVIFGVELVLCLLCLAGEFGVCAHREAKPPHKAVVHPDKSTRADRVGQQNGQMMADTGQRADSKRFLIDVYPYPSPADIDERPQSLLPSHLVCTPN